MFFTLLGTRVQTTPGAEHPASGALRGRILATFAAVLIGLVAACSRQPPLIPDTPFDTPSPRAPDSFLVVFETTRGDFTVLARRDWAPLGVDRFHDLVRRKFYDSLTVFRVVEGFVAQFGITDSLEVNRAWADRPFDDEPVVAQNTAGRVSFARSGPRTRTVQIFINLGDNSRLDSLRSPGVVGYPPVGEVVEGMDAVRAFESRWGNSPASYQDSIQESGRTFLDREYPGLDRILTARVTRRWR